MKTKIALTILFLTMLLLIACQPMAVSPTATSIEPTATGVKEEPTAVSPTATSAAEPPTPEAETAPAGVVEYNLGETTIIQSNFPQYSRFHDMPVRLNGIIAAPADGDGPYPIVVVLHGTHPGCPTDEAGIDRWPCDPEVEQPNYQGFDYLAEALAQEGYVDLSQINEIALLFDQTDSGTLFIGDVELVGG